MARGWLAAGMIAALLGISPAAHAADRMTVFAATSLTGALDDIAAEYAAKTGTRPVLSFAASSTLARQIEASGGADIFISADAEWMDYLESRGLVVRTTRHTIAGNHLVLIAPAAAAITLVIAPHFDLLGALHGGRLAIADPDSVPAGRYARAALITLGVWNAVVNHTVNAENVRVALSYVARGEAPLGIVYATDALGETRVRLVAAFPDNTHEAIVYPAALTRDARPGAREFLEFLDSAPSRAILQKYGFVILEARP